MGYPSSSPSTQPTLHQISTNELEVVESQTNIPSLSPTNENNAKEASVTNEFGFGLAPIIFISLSAFCLLCCILFLIRSRKIGQRKNMYIIEKNTNPSPMLFATDEQAQKQKIEPVPTVPLSPVINVTAGD